MRSNSRMDAQRYGPLTCVSPSDVGHSLRLAPGREQQVNGHDSAVPRESDEIDPETWARLLGTLLRAANMSPEQAAMPAGPVPASWGTIRKWLTKRQGVTARSVRDVARALDYPPARALVEVGFLTPGEVGVTGLAAPPAPVSDPLVRKIAASFADRRVPEKNRAILRRLLQSAYDAYLDMNQNKPVYEPSPEVRPAKSTGGRRAAQPSDTPTQQQRPGRVRN